MYCERLSWGNKIDHFFLLGWNLYTFRSLVSEQNVIQMWNVFAYALDNQAFEAISLVLNGSNVLHLVVSSTSKELQGFKKVKLGVHMIMTLLWDSKRQMPLAKVSRMLKLFNPWYTAPKYVFFRDDLRLKTNVVTSKKKRSNVAFIRLKIWVQKLNFPNFSYIFKLYPEICVFLIYVCTSCLSLCI